MNNKMEKLAEITEGMSDRELDAFLMALTDEERLEVWALCKENLKLTGAS